MKKPNKHNLLEAGSWQLDAFSPNEANFSHRAYIESRFPVNPRGIKADRACPNEPNFALFLILLPFTIYLFPFLRNEPNYPVHPVNLVKKRNEAKFSPPRPRPVKEFVTLCRKIAYRLDTA